MRLNFSIIKNMEMFDIDLFKLRHSSRLVCYLFSISIIIIIIIIIILKISVFGGSINLIFWFNNFVKLKKLN